MSIESINTELDYLLDETKKREEGSDGQRIYTLLESGELRKECCKNFEILGIENISFQVYQLAGEKFFDMSANVFVPGGKAILLYFPKNPVSTAECIEFFSEVENVAAAAGAVGLAGMANQAAVLASRSQFPSDKNSEYLRCMESCDHIEFELFKLLCYLACTIWTDDTPGS